MGSCIKTMGIVAAVVQGIAVLIAAVSTGAAGIIVFVAGAFSTVLSTLLILAIGEILETTDALRGAVSTLTYKVEQLEKWDGAQSVNIQATTASGRSYTVSSAGAQNYQGIPAWQRVEMEREQKLKDQEQRQ